MKLNYHVFTAKAFEAVYEALENSEVAKTAQMYAGTLFVKCNAYSAAKIETALIKELECGVRVSRVGPEYAFDFV
jgi:hypothetical protein